MLDHSQDQTRWSGTLARAAFRSLIVDSALATITISTTATNPAAATSAVRRCAPFIPPQPPLVTGASGVVPADPPATPWT